jgi:hypothetical protein
MTNAQITSLLSALHAASVSSREQMLDASVSVFGVSSDNIPELKSQIMASFRNGIGNLNAQQLMNLAEEWSGGSDVKRIVDKLTFYGIAEQFHQPILNYLEGYKLTNDSMSVTDMDESFEGLQVVTRDSFHKLITDGYSGVWKVNPAKVKPLRLQIASMNDDGPHPRGWYIQADITKFEEVKYEGQKRYCIYFKNAVTIDSGYRNVKFGQQPVTYIQRNNAMNNATTDSYTPS